MPKFDHQGKNKPLRILHVNDQAGVSGVMCLYQKRLGHFADVVARKGYDVFGQQAFYNDRMVGLGKKDFKKYGKLGLFLKLCWRTINTLFFYIYIAIISVRYDVVHIHSQYLVSLFLPFKPKLIEFHGSDIRRTPSRRWRIDKFVTSLFIKFNGDKTFYVSTPDLLEDLPNAKYLPNPIDTEHFVKRKKQAYGSAFYIHNWYETDIERPCALANKLNLKLKVADRNNNQAVLYKDFPSYLGQYEYFIDRYNIKSLSKTALEALSLGLKVIDFNNEIIEGFKQEHDPKTVAEFTIKLYHKELAK